MPRPTTLSDSNLKELILWLLGRRKRFHVVEQSMLPTLKAGDDVLTDLRAYQTDRPQINDIIVALHPNKPEMKIIKRVTDVDADGRCFVEGDNALASEDSRAYGRLEMRLILGRVTSRFG